VNVKAASVPTGFVQLKPSIFVDHVEANRPDPALAAKLDHALAELARVQAAHGDGYIGGTMVDRDGKQG
jgi:hypothetical protein